MRKFSKGYNKENPKLGRPPVEELEKYFLSLDLKGEVQLGLLDNRHVLIRLNLQEDYIRIYSRPVWYVKAIPMRILKWTSSFHVDREPPVVAAWISFPKLPVHFFHPTALFAIASLIGTPLRMDAATQNLKRPSITMTQIELDLLRDKPKKI